MAPVPLSLSLISTLIKPRADADIDVHPHGYVLHERSTTAAIVNSRSSLVRRQTQVVSIPATYGGLNAGPSPGVVAGIILGSVGGFLLLLYIIYTAVAWNNSRLNITEEDIVVQRSPSHRRRSREVVEVVRSRSPPRSRHHHDRIVVDESVTTQTEDDVVEVIEEASSVEPAPRRSRRSGGSYRTVDPYEYGGGQAPPRRVRR